MTKGDRIRSMSNEELADLLESHQHGCACCTMRYENCKTMDDLSCNEQILKWINQQE